MVIEVKHRLPRSEFLTSDKHQRRHLGLRMSRTQMLQNPPSSVLLLHDLRRHRPRSSLHPTQKRTHTPPETPLTRHNTTTNTKTSPKRSNSGQAPAKLALLLGSEGHGLSADWIETADARLNIAMAAGIDSLNVAAAASIFAYALRARS